MEKFLEWAGENSVALIGSVVAFLAIVVGQITTRQTIKSEMAKQKSEIYLEGLKLTHFRLLDDCMKIIHEVSSGVGYEERAKLIAKRLREFKDDPDVVAVLGDRFEKNIDDFENSFDDNIITLPSVDLDELVREINTYGTQEAMQILGALVELLAPFGEMGDDFECTLGEAKEYVSLLILLFCQLKYDVTSLPTSPQDLYKTLGGELQYEDVHEFLKINNLLVDRYGFSKMLRVSKWQLRLEGYRIKKSSSKWLGRVVWAATLYSMLFSATVLFGVLPHGVMGGVTLLVCAIALAILLVDIIAENKPIGMGRMIMIVNLVWLLAVLITIFVVAGILTYMELR